MANSSQVLFSRAEHLKDLISFYKSQDLAILEKKSSSENETGNKPRNKKIFKPAKANVKYNQVSLINLDDDLDKGFERF